MDVDDQLPDWLPAWCEAHLGVRPVQALAVRAQMSDVFSVRLADGRQVAVKARDDEDDRASACVAAQTAIAERGFPCARPLTPVTVVDGVAVHAEQWRPGGDLLRGDGRDVAGHFARVLAWLMDELEGVQVQPPLPNPPWVRWQHDDPGTWPVASWLEGRDEGLLPAFIEDTARRATARLLRSRRPCVLGHADWETQNLRWHGHEPWAVHDWDSLAWLPEAAIVGAAAGAFASAETPTLAPVASSEAFLAVYQQQRARDFDSDELELAWAASLWPAAHNARGQALFERPPVAEAALREQAAVRLARAGA